MKNTNMTIKEKIALLEVLDEVISHCRACAECYEPANENDIYSINRQNAYRTIIKELEKLV